jgi:hypothetical protein
MNYQIDKIEGHEVVVGHFFKAYEIEVGSRWISVCGYIVTVEGINQYGSVPDPWFEVVYSWNENGEKKTHHKGTFSFQCRYFLIVE